MNRTIKPAIDSPKGHTFTSIGLKILVPFIAFIVYQLFSSAPITSTSTSMPTSPKATDVLFAPLHIGGTMLKNRITVSAATRNRAENTYPTELMKEYYVQRASAGLIVTEGVLITRQGTETPNAPGLWDEKHVAGWKNITDAVHDAGGKIYAQLWHVGRAANTDAPERILSGMPVYAPSAIRARAGKYRQLPGSPGHSTPTAIEDPWTIIAQYKQAAINAKKAGFDGVELHAANGYLVHQFLDNTSNQRTDEWGGHAENRVRFGLEALKVLREVFGPNVGVKLSPAGGYNDIGMPLQDTLDTYNYFIKEADKMDLAYIVLLRYTEDADVVIDGAHRATKFDVLSSLRSSIINAKVFLNAGVTAEMGSKLVTEGKIDAIAVGFDYISHPDLAERVRHGKPLNNVPNIKYMQVNKDAEDWSTGYTDYPLASY